MTSDYLTLGPTPCDEPCEQIGDSYNSTRARQEMKAYINQLRRQSPDANLHIKSFPHDFGTYSEVCVIYNPDNEESANIAFDLESNLPANWDEKAIEELKEFGYFP